MAHTTFVDGVTVSAASWFNDVDTVAYTLFGNGTIYTGALTLGASGNITVNTNKFSVTASTGSTIVAGTLTLGGTTPASNSTISLFLQGTNTYKNWAITSNIYANGSLAFTPSTLNGGTNYSTPVLSLSSTTPGATITGALTVTDSLTAGAISGTTGTFNGQVSINSGNGLLLQNATANDSILLYNSGATGTSTAVFRRTGVDILNISSTGLAATGTLTATGYIQAYSGTATPVGGSASGPAIIMGSAGVGFYIGDGAPSFNAPKGSIYTNTTAATTTTRLYINISGGNSWASFTASS